MPYANPERRREYNKAYKRMQRAQGLTKKSIDTRLTPLKLTTAEDLRGLVNEVVEEARNANGSSLTFEAKLRIKLRAIEIGLRVIEITNHEHRIAALEEQLK
jgi:polyhydroxyalkanoate synthesis regulator phasin